VTAGCTAVPHPPPSTVPLFLFLSLWLFPLLRNPLRKLLVRSEEAPGVFFKALAGFLVFLPNFDDAEDEEDDVRGGGGSGGGEEEDEVRSMHTAAASSPLLLPAPALKEKRSSADIPAALSPMEALLPPSPSV